MSVLELSASQVRRIEEQQGDMPTVVGIVDAATIVIWLQKRSRKRAHLLSLFELSRSRASATVQQVDLGRTVSTVRD